MRPLVDRLLEADDLPAALLRLALALQAGILSAPVLKMRALVAAESARFPEVSRGYVDESWNRNIAMLATGFAELQRRGMLRAADPRTAAQQFTWLSIAEPLNEWTLVGERQGDDLPRLGLIAESAVATFIARYGRDD